MTDLRRKILWMFSLSDQMKEEVATTALYSIILTIEIQYDAGLNLLLHCKQSNLERGHI